jgi:hypothetical protein
LLAVLVDKPVVRLRAARTTAMLAGRWGAGGLVTGGPVAGGSAPDRSSVWNTSAAAPTALAVCRLLTVTLVAAMGRRNALVRSVSRMTGRKICSTAWKCSPPMMTSSTSTRLTTVSKAVASWSAARASRLASGPGGAPDWAAATTASTLPNSP